MGEVTWGMAVPPTDYIEYQWPLSGVHSIMRVKSAQAGEGGGACPPPFIISTITCKVALHCTLQLKGQRHSGLSAGEYTVYHAHIFDGEVTKGTSLLLCPSKNV